MGSSTKVAKGVVWSTVVNVVNALYGFVSVPILLAYFGKSEYGLIALAMSVNVYLRLMDLGFNSTNVRFFSAWLAKHDYDKMVRMFRTSLAFYGSVGIINALVILVVACFSGSMFHLEPEQDAILRQLFMVLMVSAVVSWFSSCFDQLIKATENVAWIQQCTLLPKLVQIVVLALTVWCKWGIVAYFLCTTFAMFVVIPFYVRKIRKDLPFIRFKPKWDKQMLREILPYCLNIFSFSIFQFSFYNLRPVFLGMQGTVEAVADFRILNGIIGVVSLFAGSFMGVLLPSSSKVVAQGNKEAYYRIAYDGTKYITIVLCFCTFGMMTVGCEVITLYVGESYLTLIPWFNLWLLCTLGVHNQAISSLILSGSDIRAITYNTAISSIIGLVLSWILIPYYQIGGVVIAFVVYLLVQLLFYYLYYWPRVMHINSWRVLLRSFLPYVACGVVLCYLIGLIFPKLSPLWGFLSKGVSFAVLYTLFVVLISSKSDRSYLRDIVHRKKK